MPLQRDPQSELLTLWAAMPQGDQSRLLSFGRALVDQRQGKRQQRAARHHPRSP